MTTKRFGARFVADDLWAESLPEYELDDFVKTTLLSSMVNELRKDEHSDVLYISKRHIENRLHGDGRTEYKLEVNIISPEGLQKIRTMFNHIARYRDNASADLNLIYICETLRDVFFKEAKIDV